MAVKMKQIQKKTIEGFVFSLFDSGCQSECSVFSFSLVVIVLI